VGALITEVLDGLAANGEEGNGKVEKAVAKVKKALTARFPIY
jgi:glycine hydroxymethyltransferase